MILLIQSLSIVNGELQNRTHRRSWKWRDPKLHLLFQSLSLCDFLCLLHFLHSFLLLHFSLLLSRSTSLGKLPFSLFGFLLFFSPFYRFPGKCFPGTNQILGIVWIFVLFVVSDLVLRIQVVSVRVSLDPVAKANVHYGKF